MNQHPNLFHVSDQDFEARVLRSPLPVIVDFTASWCPPCRVIAPVFEKLSDEYAGRMNFAEMDTDAHQLVPSRFGVQGMPTFIIFKDGAVIERIVGAYPARLKQTIEKALATAQGLSSAPSSL